MEIQENVPSCQIIAGSPWTAAVCGIVDKGDENGLSGQYAANYVKKRLITRQHLITGVKRTSIDFGQGSTYLPVPAPMYSSGCSLRRHRASMLQISFQIIIMYIEKEK